MVSGLVCLLDNTGGCYQPGLLFRFDVPLGPCGSDRAAPAVASIRSCGTSIFLDGRFSSGACARQVDLGTGSLGNGHPIILDPIWFDPDCQFVASCDEAVYGSGLMNFLRLFRVFFRLGALNEMAYRANFWIQIFESLLGLGTVLGLVGVVMSQTDNLGGWRSTELIAIVGVYFTMLGLINFVIAPSLSRFMNDVRQGTLDYTLTKPEDAQLLVSISEIRIWKLLDVIFGVLILGWALSHLAYDIGFVSSLSFGIALFAGGAMVYSFWLVLATLAFWFIRIENILQIFWMVYSAGRWPISIYPDWLRWTLTLVVPVAFAVTVPVEAVTGRLEGETLIGVVVLASAMFAGSRVFWKFGLKHYSGASA